METKVLIIAAVLAVACALDSEEQEIKEVQEKCAKKHGVPLEDIPKLDTDDDLWEKRSTKEYQLCLYQEWDIVDKNGKINVEKFKEEFEDEVSNVEKHLKTCEAKHKSENDLAERIYKIQNCVYDEDEKEQEN